MQTSSKISSINTDKFYTYQKNNSFLLSFEGIEGSGKSTQINLLANYLKENNFEVLILREPGGTKFGEGLRNAILNSESPLEPMAEAYLFAASRAQLLKEKILPFLAMENHIVILDRYIDSSLAYQGVARNLGIENILKFHEYSPLNILPNLTFYLSISMETSMRRQQARGSEKDYFEKENTEFYQKLIDGFNSCVNIFPKRIETIDASLDIKSVSTAIQRTFEKRIINNE